MLLNLRLAIVFALCSFSFESSAEPIAAQNRSASQHRDLWSFFGHGGYALGRNFSPRVGSIEDAYLSQILIDGGIIYLNRQGSGFAFGPHFLVNIGHNAGTATEALAGGFLRLHFQGLYSKIGLYKGLTKEEYRSDLFAFSVGFSLPLGHFGPGIELGLQAGETKIDSFVGFITVGIATDFYFTKAAL